MFTATFLALLLAGNAPLSGGQNPAITLGHTETLHSQILDEDRQLYLYLPVGYASPDPDRRYPVLVLLDGHSSIKMVAGMVHGLAESRVIPRTIVVGVGNTDRWRDLTPSKVEGLPSSGGAEAFLAFLAEELLPYLDDAYRTSGYRILSGHSLGGLTALQALVECPEVFDAYICLSPSLEWDDGQFLAEVQGSLARTKRLERQLFLCLADERLERPYFDELLSFLERKAPAGLDWESRIFEQRDDHASVRVTGGLAGIRAVYDGWRLTSAQIVRMSDEETAEFLARASKTYEQPRALDMMEVTNAGYYAIHDPATLERGLELFRQAVARWPDNPYPYACMGEGLERSGRLEQALEWMERALERLAHDPFGDPAYYRSMAARVRSKLERRPG